MRRFKILFLFLLFSLFQGSLNPAFSNSFFEIPSEKITFISSNTDSNPEIKAIPVIASNSTIKKTYKPSQLHQIVLKLYKNTLPELHNQIIKINTRIPQSSGNKYLNFIYDFQTVK